MNPVLQAFPLIPEVDLFRALVLLSPVVVVLLTAVLVEVVDLFVPDWGSRRFLMWIATVGLLLAGLAVAIIAPAAQDNPVAFGGFVRVDSFALFFHVIFIIAAALVILSSSSFMDRQQQFEGEFYSVTLYCTAALMVMATAAELISIYLALEVSSLSLAFLAAWYRRERVAAQGLKSTEAGMKFFLLSAMSSAILLYGMALLYGVTGATTLVEIAEALRVGTSPAALLAVAMLIAGFGFKVAVAPFQLWTPDVYQGAPTPATAYFSVASKAAGFAVLMRVFMVGLPDLVAQWSFLFGVLAFITMTVGNLIAIVQTNIKRLMAYSSITHVGYMLIGLAAASVPGTSGIMYYLLAYAFTNLAAFIVIAIMARNVPNDEIAGYAGLASRSPVMALGLTAALLSLAGIPPFVGFFSKLYLFLAAIEREDAGLQFLVFWAVLMSAVSLYYYGRVIHVMWMREPSEQVEVMPVRPGFSQYVALSASVAGVVLVGIVATPFLLAAQDAAIALLR